MVARQLAEFVEAPPLAPEILARYPTIELDAIDLSRFDESPEARKELAAQLEKSVTTIGFFNLINTGHDPNKMRRLRNIAQALLDIPEAEKLEYLAGTRYSDQEDKSKSLGGERGQGFKPRGYWSMANGVRDAIEHYNMRDLTQDDRLTPEAIAKHPEILREYIYELAEYYRFVHNDLLKKTCSLCDIILELEDGTTWKHYDTHQGDYDNSGSGWLRLMKYLKMNSDDQRKVDNTLLRGHSDGTGFTFIASQPLLSLQVRDYYTGEWKYVTHRENSFIVNIGDAEEFMTGGYFKSSIHRVVASPKEQEQYTRQVIIYFSTPSKVTILDPEEDDSPKLKRLGFTKPPEWDKITFREWDQEKASLFGKSKVNNVTGDEPVAVKLYGRLHERWHQADKKDYVKIIES
ncbi:unnamed protein product [Kuraishia capsulata CBS 1993]|uniref:Fe2OG dioxygenase domain-containing protein n=1 Tax=Kuraishia capsulata CBS 1993 TaxID=1382522 RepID=W6MT64_9ASCO|nr:uncharacterized protein KUCA_T00006001001 [Kuraishia capsulata CBS 1993]CDK30006.1 unnamed protein product [Kuraishia capsulata CBS 1993]